VERAIAVAKQHCTVLSGKIEGTARLATPSDLGASEVLDKEQNR
jgi:hypothetical protein